MEIQEEYSLSLFSSLFSSRNLSITALGSKIFRIDNRPDNRQ